MAKTKLLGSEKQEKEKKQKAEKKKRRSPIKYIKDVISELKKVTWPTFKNLLVYTSAVIVFIVIVAIIIGAFDLGLSALMNLMVN